LSIISQVARSTLILLGHALDEVHHPGRRRKLGMPSAR